jgi:hypothetical protein
VLKNSKPLVIDIYSWDSNKDFVYQAVFKKDVTLKFLYYGSIHTERTLTEFEAELLRNLVRKIKIDLLPDEPINFQWMLPNVSTRVVIKSQFGKVDISWASNDELTYKKSFVVLLKLIETVQDMLSVDLTGLDLPEFL